VYQDSIAYKVGKEAVQTSSSSIQDCLTSHILITIKSFQHTLRNQDLVVFFSVVTRVVGQK